MNQDFYEVVPNIITGKDLDYLSDMFEWNYGALKKVNDAIHNVEDETIKEMLQNGYNLFNSNLTKILNILNEGGSNE